MKNKKADKSFRRRNQHRFLLFLNSIILYSCSTLPNWQTYQEPTVENIQKTCIHNNTTFNGWNGHKLCCPLHEVSLFKNRKLAYDTGSYTRVIFSRHFKLENSLSEFEKDPRGKPTFTEVFILQEQTVSIVGIAVFIHTLYLIQILSSINHVYGEFQCVNETTVTIVQFHKNRSVLPLLIKIIRSPLVHLMITLVFPLQIAISIGGVVLFSANSEMLRDIFSFLKVVLWQGYLSGGFK